MRSLAKERPLLAKTYNIGHSVLGQNLEVVFWRISFVDNLDVEF